MWTVYILLCSDNSLYTGITNDLPKRLKNHNDGKGGAYTRSHKPLKLIYLESQPNKSEALKREIQIKSWTKKEKISRLKLQY